MITICPKCSGEIVAIGEDIINNFESVYIHECQDCHEIIRLLYKVKPKKVWSVS